MPSDWERVAADPVLLAALRARYPGRGDVLDQLWWAEHPARPTPAGIPDPVVALGAARTALYRPGADPGDAQRVGREEAEAADDREAALRVLRLVDTERPAPPRAVEGPARPSIALLVGAVVAALVVGAGAGFATGRFSSGTAPTALQVFDRDQREADLPPASASLPAGIRRSTLREVGSASSSGTVLYGARADASRVCLVAVVLAADSVATCSSDAAFARSGLTLGFAVRVDPENDAPAVPQQFSATWLPDGGVRFG